MEILRRRKRKIKMTEINKIIVKKLKGWKNLYEDEKGVIHIMKFRKNEIVKNVKDRLGETRKKFIKNYSR